MVLTQTRSNARTIAAPTPTPMPAHNPLNAWEALTHAFEMVDNVVSVCLGEGYQPDDIIELGQRFGWQAQLGAKAPQSLAYALGPGTIAGRAANGATRTTKTGGRAKTTTGRGGGRSTTTSRGRKGSGASAVGVT